MPDNVPITPGAGTTVRTDELADGVQIQVIKLALGADGAEDNLVDSGQQPMAVSVPVVLASDHTDVKVTLDSEAVVLGAGTANVGDVDVASVPAPLNVTGNGAAATALRMTLASDSTGQVKLAANDGVDIGNVDVASIVPGTGATNLGKAIDTALGATDTGVLALAVRDDTLNVRSGTENDVEPLHTDALGALWTHPMGDVAHDAADSGNPLKVGARAVNAEPAAVANNDRANLITDLVGKLITLPYANPENQVSGATAAITDTTHTSIIAAAGNGVRNYITSLLVTNSHGTVGTVVQITDGSGGTVLWQGFAAALGGGFACTFPTPLKTTANTALYCECVTTGANVYVCAAGYKGV